MNDSRLSLLRTLSRERFYAAVFWPEYGGYGNPNKATEESVIHVCERLVKLGYGIGQSEIHVIDARGSTKKIYKFTPKETDANI